MLTFAKMEIHEQYMQRCIELASLGAGTVSPNPMVGAVLVYDGKILSEGYHKNFGEQHAEVHAIENIPIDATHLLPQAILYINLEPCTHYGKTPPCADLIIEKKIKKVVIGILDPNVLVHAKGYKKLVDAGIEVQVGVLENACRDINKFFFSYHEKKRAYITLKWAQSNDGFIAGKNFERLHLTNDQSDTLVHKIRSENMAIFAGGRTIVKDNPQLTVRHWHGKNPIRVSFDSKGSFPSTLQIFNTGADTIVFTFSKDSIENNVQFIKIHKHENYTNQILEHLYKKQINSLLVEGGSQTLKDFIHAGLWDEANIFITAFELKEGIAAPNIPGTVITSKSIFDNTLLTSIPA